MTPRLQTQSDGCTLALSINKSLRIPRVLDETRTKLNDLCFTRIAHYLIDGVPFIDITKTLLKGVGGRTLIMRVDSYRYVELRVICTEHTI